MEEYVRIDMTDHAITRFRQRLNCCGYGIKNWEIKRFVQYVYNCGIRLEDAKDVNLANHIKYHYSKSKKFLNRKDVWIDIRIWDGFLYIFFDRVLRTVYKLSPFYFNKALEAQKEKEEAQNETDNQNPDENKQCCDGNSSIIPDAADFPSDNISKK